MPFFGVLLYLNQNLKITIIGVLKIIMRVFSRRVTQFESALKKSFLSASIALISLNSHGKELLGLNFSATAWQADLQGHVQSPDSTASETDPSAPGTQFSMFEVGVNEPKPRSYSIEWRHKMKNLPRAMYRVDNIERTATTTPSRAIQYYDGAYEPGVALESSADLSFTQITLYYSTQDTNWYMDIGASQREYDGHLRLEQAAVDDVTGEATTGDPTLMTAAIIGKVDMAYFDIAYRLSPTSLLAARINQDIEAGVTHYDAEYGLRFLQGGSFASHKVEMGYRKFIIKTQQFDDLSANLKLGGPYLRWTLAF